MGRQSYVGVAVILALSLLGTVGQASAQTLQRQSIGSMGAGSNLGNLFVQESIGQSYSTVSQTTDNTYYSQGFLKPILGAGTLSWTVNVKAYPNPSSSYVNVELGEVMSGVSLQVLDLHGQAVSTQSFNGSRILTLNTLDWSQGVYFINIKYRGMVTHTSKIIVTH